MREHLGGHRFEECHNAAQLRVVQILQLKRLRYAELLEERFDALSDDMDEGRADVLANALSACSGKFKDQAASCTGYLRMLGRSFVSI